MIDISNKMKPTCFGDHKHYPAHRPEYVSALAENIVFDKARKVMDEAAATAGVILEPTVLVSDDLGPILEDSTEALNQ